MNKQPTIDEVKKELEALKASNKDLLARQKLNDVEKLQDQIKELGDANEKMKQEKELGNEKLLNEKLLLEKDNEILTQKLALNKDFSADNTPEKKEKWSFTPTDYNGEKIENEDKEKNEKGE